MENTEKQHLDLIAEMIESARQDFSDDSFIYLLWGWTVCLAALAEFILIALNNPYHSLVWTSMPLVAIVQIFVLFRNKKQEKVRSHLDRAIGYVWIAVGVCLVVVLCSASVLQAATYPVLILLYGIGTFISGGIMKLKPMMFGAACCWVIGAAAFYFKLEYQLLLLSLSLILSYIIPGHLLKNRFKRNV